MSLLDRWASTSTRAARWANNMVYNIHLLTGKISHAGQQPVQR
jgi:anaerobic selenocysteine-containing dehydrogenase